MRKKLIGLAVAGALAAPFAAQAQGSNVQIYGLLQPSLDFVDNGDDDGHFIQDNNSRLGFKGSEDLGGGLKAIFQLESRVNFDERGDGGGRWMNRDSWLGLAGGFGSLTVGNHQSAYVRSSAFLDPFADTIGDYNNVMSVYGVGQLDFNNRFRNSVYYTSPTFGGVQILASYALRSEGFDDDGPGPDPDDDNTWSIAATWKSGPVALVAAYERQKGASNPVLGIADADPWGVKLGGSLKVLPTTTLYAMVDRLDTDTDADERWAYYLGAKHSMGSIDLLANVMYARGSDGGLVYDPDEDPTTPNVTLGDDDGALAFSIGAVYNFSKRTNIGAYYSRVDNDDDGIYGLDSGGYEPSDVGETVQAISVRLRHSF